MEINITEFQMGLMKHAISGHDRNWFATDSRCADAKAFDELVEAGLATKRKAPSWTCDDVIYSLTDSGKSMAIKS